MLLPDRKTIRTLLEERKRQSAVEGLSLANKVEALRQELNELKSNREEFIQGTIAEINKQTQSLYEKRDSLKQEIEILEGLKVKLKDLIQCALTT